MNESDYQDLLVTAAHRELTAAEHARLEAWWAAHPEGRADWELEQRLTRCLLLLPDAPLSTNFTSEVLHRVDRLDRRRPQRPTPAWLRWLGGLRYGWSIAGAVGALALILAVQERARHRAELAASLETLPAISLAEVDLWRDFESINNLPAGPVPSVDQLAEAFK